MNRMAASSASLSSDVTVYGNGIVRCIDCIEKSPMLDPVLNGAIEIIIFVTNLTELGNDVVGPSAL